jgi:tight adherence protein C
LTPQIFLAALASTALAVIVARQAVPPRKSLSLRLRPYAALSRSRLGTGYADVSVSAITRIDGRSPTMRVFGPLLERMAEWLGGIIDAADGDTLALRLRQAGFNDVGPEQYRIRQLGYAVGGVALGVFVGLTVMNSFGGVVFMAVCFGFPGATVQRNRVERAIEVRRDRMRSEAYTVAQLMAVHVRTGHGPVEAVRAVCKLGRGPVVSELREALAWISGGTSPQRAYEKLAESTPEPSVGRLYRLLSASSRSGGDIGKALLAISNDLRAERREELARYAVKRGTAMLLPLILFIAPVMVLFVGAAIPHLIFGGS